MKISRILIAAIVFLILSVVPARAQSAVQLNWNAATGGGVPVTYNILRGTAKGAEIFLASVPATVTTYKDTTPVLGITYFYEVTATNSAGTSGPSNEITVPFGVTKPQHPTGLGYVILP